MKYRIILALYFIALIFSILITVKPISNICNPYEGCDTVLNSKYAQFLGLKTSIWGIIAISIVIITIFGYLKNHDKGKQNFIKVPVILGAIVAVFLLYLQEFVINAYCKYCIAVDTCLITSTIILIAWKRS
jgi:uncharacterized membrane protein